MGWPTGVLGGCSVTMVLSDKYVLCMRWGPCLAICKVVSEKYNTYQEAEALTWNLHKFVFFAETGAPWISGLHRFTSFKKVVALQDFDCLNCFAHVHEMVPPYHANKSGCIFSSSRGNVFYPLIRRKVLDMKCLIAHEIMSLTDITTFRLSFWRFCVQNPYEAWRILVHLYCFGKVIRDQTLIGYTRIDIPDSWRRVCNWRPSAARVENHP